MSTLKCRSLFQQILLKIVEASEELNKSIKFNSNTTEDLLSTVNKFVSDNLHRKIYSSEIAQEVGLSESHFRYLFSTIYKTNPSDFVLRKKNRKVKELLLSNQSITSIAYELAFHPVSIFPTHLRN